MIGQMWIGRFVYFESSGMQAASFGGSNIDPTAWEDKKCKGESRFPAQVVCLGFWNGRVHILVFPEDVELNE